MITQRRICWPNPDATCLQGGCLYCNDRRFRALTTIEHYARHAGVLPHRGKGEQDAWRAYLVGYRNSFFNVDTR